METSPLSSRSLEKFFHINGDSFEKQYKDKLSGFRQWSAFSHADEWLIFPDNIGPSICIDETSLSNGELYTLITNRASRGGKGTIIAIIQGVKTDDIIQTLRLIPLKQRELVEEITLDFSNGMNLIARRCFPKALRTIDRFHMQKLACDALQEMRIAYRWDAINNDNALRKQAKESGEEYKPLVFSNGDSHKQLLARSRYLLFKSPDKWSCSQKVRSSILFEQYPDLEEAYSLTHSLRQIFNKNTIKDAARLSLARWYDKVEKAGFKSFKTIGKTLYSNSEEVLNFFVNRSTNAFAESFNAKIKSFRANLRGVIDVKFFLFRLTKLYA